MRTLPRVVVNMSLATWLCRRTAGIASPVKPFTALDRHCRRWDPVNSVGEVLISITQTLSPWVDEARKSVTICAASATPHQQLGYLPICRVSLPCHR